MEKKRIAVVKTTKRQWDVDRSCQTTPGEQDTDVLKEGEAKARAAEKYIAKEKRQKKLFALKQKLTKNQRKYDLLEAIYLPSLIISFVIGLIAGIAVAVTLMLERHGPTVTFFGTMGAICLYLIAGLFLGGFFAWLTKDWLKTEMDNIKNRIKETETEVESLSN